MIEINAKSPSKLADEVESWIRSLPDPADALERVGSEVADLVPRRRRSRNWLGLALPAVAAMIVAGVATLWLFTHRSPSPDRFGLDELVPDGQDFDRDAGIRAASEGMPAPDRAGLPADDGNL